MHEPVLSLWVLEKLYNSADSSCTYTYSDVTRDITADGSAKICLLHSLVPGPMLKLV